MRSPMIPNQQEERGVALLLALFALVLISAVGVAIVFLSAGETSIVSNERSYATSWEAAKGGLEEMRSRLSGSDNSYIGDANRPLDGTHVFYIINPKGSETVDPYTSSNAYYDSEYFTEWGVQISSLPSANVSRTTPSDMQSLVPTSLPFVPYYKWARLTIKTEKSANEDINSDGCFNPTPNTPCSTLIPVTYDPTANRQTMGTVSNPSPITMVYRIASLAVLPNGTKTMLEYDLKPGTPIPPLDGALTLCGQVAPWVLFYGPNSMGWKFKGNDGGGSQNVEAIGVCNEGSKNAVISGAPGYTGTGIPSGREGNYTGAGGSSDDVVDEGPAPAGNSMLSPCMYNVACLNSLVQSIIASADKVYIGPQSGLYLGSTDGPPPSAPQITVVQDKTSPSFQPGDLTQNGGCAGSGILLVTGTLTCKGNGTFNGIILVIGQGVMKVNGPGGSPFQGEWFVAQIRDSSGNLEAQLGAPTFDASGGGSSSMQFNSALVNQVQNSFPWKVLMAREINP